MSEIKSYTSEKRIVETTKLSCKEVSEKLSVYTTWVTTEVVGSGVAPATKITKQGLVENANLTKLRKGKVVVPDFSPIKSDKDRRFHPALISVEGREYIRLNGSPMAYAKVWEHLVEGGMLKLPKDDTPWVEVVDETNVSDLCFMSMSDHSIVDLSGHLLPAARTFEFMNGSYDLEKACLVLDQNPEMEIIPDRFGNLMHNIPSYNVSELGTMEMKVKWVPGAESWASFTERLAERKNPNGSPVLRLSEYEMLVEFDVLGLTAAGCRREPKYSEE
jgi:hypothetical protein